MKGISLRTKILLAFLSVVFTIALTYASIVLPDHINSILFNSFDFPGYDVKHPMNIERAEVFLDDNYIRWIGYGSLTLVVILIIIGFIAEKRGLATLGAIAFFLPVFGHFTFNMFFLAGLGFLRVIWMPILDVSYEILKLGDISYIPFYIAEYFMSLMKVDLRDPLIYLLIGGGILIFILSTIDWFYAKLRKENVTKFGLYRYSRHPQYLGWIIWSYGILLYVHLHSQLIRFKLCYEMYSSLPWLIATFIIVGVAMLEEIKMRKLFGKEYESYIEKTPFLFSIPKFMSTILKLPVRLILRKDYPEKGGEVALIMAAYIVIMILLSIPLVI